MLFSQRRLSRRLLLQRGAAATAGAFAIVAVGCGDDDDGGADTTATAPSGPTTDPAGASTSTPMEKKLVHGWYRGQEVVYYDFGMSSPSSGGAVSTAPIWAFITGMDADGNPQFVQGQHNVVDAIPGEPGYSDLWEVRLVTVPEGYEPDSIRSREQVESSGYDIAPAGIFVNCPVVPAGTTFENGEQLVQGWYRSEPVFYPDFGPNRPFAIPIWAFITGMDAAGNPQFLDGQDNIIDALPGDPAYSAFWQVNLVLVDGSYQANAIRSAAGVVASGFEVTATDLVVNCPVVTA